MAELVERRRPLRRDEYEHMVEAGFFEGERVELVRGVIVEMSPQNLPHSAAIQLLTRWLQPALVGRADVRVQLPFNVGDDSVPEPDFALVAPVIRRDAHPDEAFLIIEVADASLAYDRREKTGLYASAGLPEYWIVNLVDRVVEKYSEPSGGSYARLVTVRVGDAVAPLAFPDVSMTVDEIVGADR
jgi:Uma2 family endonuclease